MTDRPTFKDGDLVNVAGREGIYVVISVLRNGDWYQIGGILGFVNYDDLSHADPDRLVEEE